MQRSIASATGLGHLIFEWYRSPVGLLTAIALCTSVIFAALGLESFSLIVLIVTIAIVLPYKLRRNEELTRQAISVALATDKTTRKHAKALEAQQQEATRTAARSRDTDQLVNHTSQALKDTSQGLKDTRNDLKRTNAKVDAVRKLERQHEARMNRIFEQTQQIAGIHSLLTPSAPLPRHNGWTLGPDAADHFVRTIVNNKPKLIVETGSGLSTILAGLALAKIGGGRIVALEHDEDYYKDTKALIAEHELTEFATVLHCPLRGLNIAGQSYDWYDLTQLDRSQSIDVLLIDGPPARTNWHARYPALPELWDMITSNTTIIVDDTGRSDEVEIIERWANEFGPMTVNLLDHERGSAVLRVAKPATGSS